ncbi:MAG TPA: outer membrane lipoprotein carrier protein LolA [Opitutaceae bacterium]|nr:outer membrane lipoprotein carrier protein LolA [Opitutaceae bacterium]
MYAAALALIASAHAEQDPGALLSPGAGEAQWRPLVEALAAKGTVMAAFTERRFFPFRRAPMLLRGVLRISPERGLSLQYTDPDESILIADSVGLLLKDREGHLRDLPSGPRGTGAMAALLPIMRFDLQALYPRFLIRACRSGAEWRFDFTPRDQETARSLGAISVRGSDSDVRRLEFRRSSSQRVEIEVGETRTGVAFSPAELKQFFR